MKVITTIKEMQTTILNEKKQGKSIGFVPTMGFLHEGHIGLIQNARKSNDIVVLSIFVNPIQFGPNEDFLSYPRDFERDQMLSERENVDYLFFPAVEEMYPASLSNTVCVKTRTEVLCGKSRPGHFDGVATVLTKLFSIVQPNNAYFGTKDAQQVAIIEALVSDFNFPINIIPIETVRESDGLAKSSRNVRLLPKERQQAPVLYESLVQARVAISEGETNPEKIITHIKEMITKRTDGIIDYVEILSYPAFEELTNIDGKIIIAIAVKFSHARLIDNIILDTREI